MGDTSPDGQDLALSIERLGEDLVFAEPDDLEALTALGLRMEEIAGTEPIKGDPRAAEVTAVLASRLKEAGSGAGGDAGKILEHTTATVSALQAMIGDGRNADEAGFPEIEDAPKPKKKTRAKPKKKARKPRGKTSKKSSRESKDTGHFPALPAHVDEAIFRDFLVAQETVLHELETLTIEMEKTGDESKRRQIQRILHTTKGESALLGLQDVERLCHATEHMLTLDGAANVTDLLLEVKDWLARTYGSFVGKGDEPQGIEELLSKLASPVPAHQDPAGEGESGDEKREASTAQDDPVAEVPQEENGAGVGTDVKEDGTDAAVAFVADPELLEEFVAESNEHLTASDQHLLTLESDPRNDEALNAVFRAFHTIKGVASFCELEEIRELAHSSENLLDLARKGEIVLEGKAIDAAFDAVDGLKRMLEAIREFLTSGKPITKDAEFPGLLARIRGAGTPEAVESAPAETESVANAEPALQDEKKELEPLSPQEPPKLDQVDTPKPKPEPPSREQQNSPQTPKTVKVNGSVKVDADRLDRLVDTIGEMVIAESMVGQAIVSRNGDATALMRHLSHLDKITRTLQEMAMSLRMVPIRSTFQKVARLVRDVAKKSGKRVDFAMTGEETELDKSVVDQIGDPLVHMVRNAVDHGLEPDAEARRAAGKSETGKIQLRAFHKGGNIHIELEDDGRGLNREKILEKARERGLIQDGEGMADRDVWHLIFEPGFSTAREVTDVSGRGVGMDVVRKSVEALRGTVAISTEPGKGSVISLRLPLTLAIIDGMVVRLGEERYIVPTLSVVCTIRPQQDELTTALQHGEMLKLQGKLIPLFRLSSLFGVCDAVSSPTEALVVVVEAEGKRVGFMVDELLGQQQIVIKSLGETMRGLPGISGGAVMPDGRVGLILDVCGLVKLAQTKTVREAVLQADY